MVTKMAAAATTEHKSGEPQSPTRPVSPEIRPRVPVSSQMEKARTSRTKIAARNARRCHNPGHRGAVGGRVDWLAARAGSDSRLDLSITKAKERQTSRCWRCSRHLDVRFVWKREPLPLSAPPDDQQGAGKERQRADARGRIDFGHNRRRHGGSRHAYYEQQHS